MTYTEETDNKCNHKALFCPYNSKIKPSKRGFQCICLECGEFISIKDLVKDNINIIYGTENNTNSFDEYYAARTKYLYYTQNGDTPSDAVDKVNAEISNSDKTYKKTTSN